MTTPIIIVVVLIACWFLFDKIPWKNPGKVVDIEPRLPDDYWDEHERKIL